MCSLGGCLGIGYHSGKSKRQIISSSSSNNSNDSAKEDVNLEIALVVVALLGEMTPSSSTTTLKQ